MGANSTEEIKTVALACVCQMQSGSRAASTQKSTSHLVQLEQLPCCCQVSHHVGPAPLLLSSSTPHCLDAFHKVFMVTHEGVPPLDRGDATDRHAWGLPVSMQKRTFIQALDRHV